jgi:hypothetical protein
VDGAIYYISAAVLWAGLAAQLPSLWRNVRSPLKRSLCTVVFFAGLCFALGAPPTVAAVNHVTGVPNAAAVLTYSAVTAFSAASLILILHWRGGDPDRVQRVCRRWLITYTAVTVLQGALFVAGEAPVERRTDFDTYYATTPFIREMIVLYLVAHMAAALTTTVLCWRWTGQIAGWTHRAFTLLVPGWICYSAYSVIKAVGVTASWSGRDWDAVSTHLAPLLGAVGTMLVTAGYVLPLLGPRVDTVLTFLRLGPLFRLLVGSARKPQTVPLSWRSLADVELHLTKRTTAIYDGLDRLAAHFDEQVRDRAYHQAIAHGSTAAEAKVIGEAAMVAVAALASPPRATPHTDSQGAEKAALEAFIPELEMMLRLLSSNLADARHRPADRQLLDTDQTSLLRLSRAVRAPIVDAVVQSQEVEK